MDIDPSEEGRTGGERKSEMAKHRQHLMHEAAGRACQELESMGAEVGGKRTRWFTRYGLPAIEGDRDIVAFHKVRRVCVIAEAEGVSGGQPETKLYKAIGQIVVAASGVCPPGWRTTFVLVVHGREIADHLGRVTAFTRLGVSALSLSDTPQKDRWLFQDPLLPKLLFGEVRVKKAEKTAEAKT
ncbi:MAG: hypothetical protein ABSH14_01950 [Verrucomicrobiia bacterium]